MVLPRLVYSFISLWAIGKFPLFDYYESCCSEHSCWLGFCVRLIILLLFIYKELDVRLSDQAKRGLGSHLLDLHFTPWKFIRLVCICEISRCTGPLLKF